MAGRREHEQKWHAIRRARERFGAFDEGAYIAIRDEIAALVPDDSAGRVYPIVTMPSGQRAVAVFNCATRQIATFLPVRWITDRALRKAVMVEGDRG